MTCDRLERDHLLGHLGEEMHPHVEECHVCRATSYGYARLAAALAQESTRELPAGWKQRALARIHAERAARRRRQAVSLGLSLASAAALILIVAPRLRDSDRPHRLRTGTGALAVSLERGEASWRAPSTGERAHRGDRVRVTSPGLAAHGELRVYRAGRELVARCPRDPAPTCRQRGDAIELSWRFAKMGVYRAVWLASPSPLQPPSGDLDADIIAAEQAGADVMESDPIDVD